MIKMSEPKNLLDKEVSKESDLLIELNDGVVVLKLVYDGKGVDGELSVKVSSDYFMDKLKEAIPGDIDDAVIDIIKAALKSAS